MLLSILRWEALAQTPAARSTHTLGQVAFMLFWSSGLPARFVLQSAKKTNQSEAEDSDGNRLMWIQQENWRDFSISMTFQRSEEGFALLNHKASSP